MSVPHDNDVSGVFNWSLPLSVHTWVRDPACGVHGVLGHAHWAFAVGVRRNSSTGGRGRKCVCVCGGGGGREEGVNN